jgi:cyanophycin synthetase
MRIIDSRRMTGSNLYTRESGALIDLAFDAVDADPHAVVAAWRRAIAQALPWPGELHVRHYAGGVALFVPGPLAALMPLTDLNEWAVACAEAEVAGQPLPVLDPAVLASITEAHVPGLAELIIAAREHDLPLLVDDESITLGTGPTLLRFARQGPLPAVSAVDWSARGRIPIGIITGTNGKTTTTRLVARMARAAGRVPGITSSDGVAVDEQLVHRGDFSGPEGTRLVLRHPGVEIAILETARGGILRRGLTVERCDAAVITNVSADHLGDYGVDDVAMMARVKAVVGRDARTVILNADDPALVAIAPSFAGDVVWFSRHPRPGVAWTVRDGQLVHGDRALVAVDDIPITFGGRATYNVENALAAAALAHALGLPDDAIVAGLRGFTSSSHDNPGRGNLVDVKGVRVLLDFGHNPAAIRGVLALARGLLAERGHGALRVTIGMPGDRLDAELREVAQEIAAGAPTQVIVCELPAYLLRGRELGVVPVLLATGLREHGVANVAFAATELDAVTRALADARPGDLVVVLAHLDPAVETLLAGAS